MYIHKHILYNMERNGGLALGSGEIRSIGFRLDCRPDDLHSMLLSLY